MDKCIVCNGDAVSFIWDNDYPICAICIKKIDFFSLFILYNNFGEDAVINVLDEIKKIIKEKENE